MRLEVRGLTCGYGGRPAVHDVFLDVESNGVLCVLGANGSGKTTLFKGILRLLQPQTGCVLLDGEDISRWSGRRSAQAFGYVPQAHTPPFPFLVRDLVLMARTAYLGIFGAPGKHDVAIAHEALESLGVADLAGALYTEISGGERQLVLIARALAQQPRVLIMDEPTSNLDFGNQLRVLRQVRDLAGRGLGVLMTTHFPNHAFLCASRVAVMKDGRVLACGRAEDVLTAERLSGIYGVPLQIFETGGDAPIRVCVPGKLP
jgi:iron complex transport system ATP-binding protein